MRKQKRRPGKRNLESGVELLDLDFLLSTVESTEGEEKSDFTMRKITFDALLSIDRIDCIDSMALKHYTINAKNLYTKDIQCAAMTELAKRTRQYGADSV